MKKKICGMREKRFFLLVFMGIFACFLWPGMESTSFSAPEAVVNPFEGNEEAISDGEELYDAFCSDCHGDGSGGSGPSLMDDEWIYGKSNGQIYASIVNGTPGGMPAMGREFKEKETWKIIAFLRVIME
jgi:cytochrome c oxidase cbb3-type subunit 3